MAVFETYAMRRRREETAGQPDVYTYDELSPFLRKQLGLIFTSCIGPGYRPGYYPEAAPPNANAEWRKIARVFDREQEDFAQSHAPDRTSHDWCIHYLTSSRHVGGVLSLIEICCGVMESMGKWPDHELQSRGVREHPADGLLEVNERFRIAGVGYKFEAGEIMRIDSEFVHDQVVKPALQLLQAPEFTEADREFRLAHEHYRSGDLRDCNTAALRSMEALLKAICQARGWEHDPGATVDKLIGIMVTNGLFPDYLGGYFNNLIGAMKAGLPKIRDRDGGHGAAPDQPAVPEHVAGFALHLAASNIVMLAQAHRSLPMRK
ncbi:MAG: STM4504/CBY_0614 family protein [Acetobacteraceae bacterium]